MTETDLEPKLKEIKQHILETGAPLSVSVREMIGWIGAARRGKHVNSTISKGLHKLGLVTKPDFQQLYVDALVSIEIAPIAVTPANVQAPTNQPEVEPPRQAFHRIGMLAAANKIPVSVARDSSVEMATTLLLLNDFSQLPVLQNPRNVVGMITWRSIAAAPIQGRPCAFVRDCMDPVVEIVDQDRPLLEVVRLILRKEVVLVRGLDGTITGLVTATDIASQFLELSEAFLLLEQIENHIRPLIDKYFSQADLKSALDPADSEREVESADDLSFGEYIRLLENPDNWQKLHLTLDRGILIKRLIQVRDIRNEVMHFHPDGIAESDIETLRLTCTFFRSLMSD